MTTKTPTIESWSTVRETELQEVSHRRAQADLPAALCQPGCVKQDAVGVALSGGGIRSGAVSLGFLQALQNLGLMRYVDYLSTVSGGGYAGAFWSSATVLDTQAKATQQLAGGQQSDRVQKLVFNGKYLARFQFFAHHLFGLLLTLTLCTSGVVAVTALVAYVLRWLDSPAIRTLVNTVRIADDLIIYQLPAIILFSLWLLFWLFHRLRARWLQTEVIVSERWPVKILFWSGMFAAIAGAGIILSTNDLDLESFTRVFGVKTKDRSLSSLLSYLMPAILTGLLPYLQPKRLINSGLAPRNIGEKFAFNFASAALFIGVPFVALFHFGKENVSNYNSQRSGLLVAGDWNDVGFNPNNVEWRRLLCFLSSDTRKKIVNQCRQVQAVASESDWLDSHFPSGLISIYATNHKNRQARRDVVQMINEELIQKTNLPDILFGSGDVKNLTVDCLKSLVKKKTEDYYFFSQLEDKEFDKYIFELHELVVDVAELSQRYESLRGQALADNLEDSVRERKEFEARDVMEQLWTANRHLITKIMGLEPSQTRRVGPTSVLAADQTYRLWRVLFGGGIFLMVLCFMNLNFTSLHPFYRQRLSANWIEKEASGSVADGAEPLMKNLQTVQQGAPYHLIGGSAYLMSFPQRTASDYIPEAFLFSQKFCGTPRIGFVSTEQYLNGELTLADAIAMSGAAVSPIQQPRLLIRLILFATNLRMGQWLPNPTTSRSSQRPLHQYFVTPASAIRRAWQILVQRRNPAATEMFLVTDGGHQENLGVGALLERRCRLIMAIDASADERFTLDDFSRLVRWARVRQGIQLSPLEHLDVQLLTPSSLAPESDPDLPTALTLKLSPTASPAAAIEALINEQADKSDRKHRWSKSHVMACEIRYPDVDEPGLLLYFKANMTGDEPLDLRQHALNNSAFPHDSTADQFFSPDQFDAYRQLGEHVLESLTESLRRPSHQLIVERLQAACARWPQTESKSEPSSCANQILNKFLATNPHS
ncbi:MAG: patatin-like phospholipase family protein [Planctomycetota bacterium]